MKTKVDTFALQGAPPWLTSDCPSFRPPSWPPPRDWIVSEDRDGTTLSRWGDATWDVSSLAGSSMSLDFGDGPRRGGNQGQPIDSANADLLRLMITWRRWGVKGVQSANGLKAIFLAVRRVVSVCSNNGIQASSLSRYPKVVDKLIDTIPPSEFGITVLELHRLWEARELLSFTIMTPAEINKIAQASPGHETEQTAYIPPRIWSYQIDRLKECLDDYLAHRKDVEKCFHFCVDAYAKNYGSLEKAVTTRSSHRLPFWTPIRPGKGSQSGCEYLGPFQDTARRFGIGGLLDKWVVPTPKGHDLRNLSAYLSLIEYAGIAFIINYSLQRVTEAASLRCDCLEWEYDEELGRIPILCGETSKTDSDSDARWPTSPNVERAIEAMSSIARMRMRCAAANPAVATSQRDRENPYLFCGIYEPWGSTKAKRYDKRIHLGSYLATLKRRFTRLFDPEQLRITPEDYRISTMFTPNLSREFEVGRIWPLAWHQLRRTTAVNMFASRLISDSSMQFLMKHISLSMPLYYGRGYTNLLLNQEVEKTIIAAMYDTQASKIESAIGERFLSPLGALRKDALIHLLSEKDSKQLAKAARDGQIHCKETRVGYCLHRGACPHGGVESIARCTGGDGNGACADALYDAEQLPSIQHEILFLDAEIAIAAVNSPRHKMLLAERQGLENYVNVFKN